MSGRAVIVTGGGKGVGRGITRRFLEAGADVVICSRGEPEEPVQAGGRKALFTAADVRDVEQIEQVVAFTKQRLGRLDVLVNNAGGAPEADAASVSPRFSESIIRLNLIAPLNFAQMANAVMHRHRRVRSRQGRAAFADDDAGRRVGAQGTRECRDRGHDPYRAGASPLR